MATRGTLGQLWDTTRMRLLVEIGRQGSVSAAAAEIGIGQPSASQHLRLLEAAEEELSALAGLQTGTIHLGSSTAPGVYLLPDTLGCFRRDHPGITVEVEIAASDEILKRLVSGRVQLALVGATEADERIELSPFLEDEIVGVAKPGFAPLKNGALAPEKLADFMLLTRERG